MVRLFEVQPGLLRINKDYGWLRAADVLDGDPDLLASVAAGAHAPRRGPLEPGGSRKALWSTRA